MRKDSYRDGLILENKEIYPNIYKLVLEGDFNGEPGQFYMLRGWESLDPFLPRPISIADLEDGKISFLYEKKGRGTHLIGSLKKGDKLSILGPLGNGFDLEELGEKKLAIVAGGIGIAPMLYLAKNLKKPDLYVGFRDRSYFLDEFKDYVGNIYVATESGEEGKKGYVTELIDSEKYEAILACGPTPMMKSLKELDGDLPMYISMESRMACGIGACTGCTIETENGMKRVCKDGPVFLAEEVVINEA